MIRLTFVLGGRLRYTEESLSRGESILFNGAPHWIVLVPPVLVGLLFALFGVATLAGQAASVGISLLLFGFAIIVWKVLSWQAIEISLTNRRVVRKSGLLRTSTREIFLGKIEGISIRSGLFGQLLGYGDVVVKGIGGTPDTFPCVVKPLDFRREIQTQIDRLHEQTLPQKGEGRVIEALENGAVRKAGWLA